MNKLNILLLLALVGSGLLLVHKQHEGRGLYTAIASEQVIQSELADENKRLQLERQNLITPARVEENAKALLQMRPASLSVTQSTPRNVQVLHGGDPQIPGGVVLSVEDAHE